MSWKCGSSSTVRSYQFLYDNQNFLTWATYLENNTANSRYTTRYVYDSMGNITTLWRYGLRDNNTYGLIDNLSYTYNGNQLVTVTDGRSGPDYSGAFHFSDGSDEDVEYEYDQNGNLTKDLNKKITQIKYNLLNLPSNIAFMINYANYYISHTYSADGRLLHTGYLIGKDMGSVPATSYPVFPHGGDELQAHIIDVPITPPIEPSLIDNSYSYCDNIIYHQGTVSQILFDGGYVTLSGSTPTYHYYLQDHLGNNRAVIKQDGTIEQVNHYYPFGGLFGESTDGDVQRFKYNGKELERMHGLDWYDYGARWHDAAIGRWATVDPMAEKYYNLSPYNYCGNNPINAIDPNGQFVRIIFDKSNNQLKILDMDYYKEGESLHYVSAKDYIKGAYNQVLVINDVFSGGIVDDESGHVVRDPNRQMEKPIPNGVYDILDNKSTNSHKNWFRLDKQDSNRYDDIDNVSGRSNFRLHIGRESWGCITINYQQDDVKEIWDLLSYIITTTSNETVRDNGDWNPFRTLTKYGILTVIGDDKIPSR